MYIPSLSTILGCIFLGYIGQATWTMMQLFTVLKCTGTPCYRYFLTTNPKLQLGLFTSTEMNPVNAKVVTVGNIRNFDYTDEFEREFDVDIPLKTRKNGTLYMFVVIALDGDPLEWSSLKRDGPTVIERISLTEYAVPRAAMFNLLDDNSKTQEFVEESPTKYVRPVTHIKSKIHITMLTDNVSVSHLDIPPEIARLIRVANKNQFLPILRHDFFRSRLRDLEEIKKDTKTYKIQLVYRPIGIGKLRLMQQIQDATISMQQLGFTEKDVDEVKGIFSDTNVYLLCGTFLISGIHMLFDFLSFKNDVIFWKRRQNYAGLSTRTTLWRAFSQIVVFLYLVDENTSLLVLVPAGIGVIIEVWKCKKILKLEFTQSLRIRRKVDVNCDKTILKAEEKTQEYDQEAMKYLSYLLYPLCIGGAAYSLIYQPHRSWYSWTLNSLVHGVYAFGFLFMLPQLFVNYKLKSVAALPWRAFMYKAFNTFIDDIFAFIITMPTAHRVACFRDDVVFIIYLYQRWLYPVDVTRIDAGASFEEHTEETTNETKKSK